MSQMLQNGSACLFVLALAHVTVIAQEPTPENLNTKAAPLSVVPLDQIDYPEDRPEWLDQSVQIDDLPHSWIVVSGPCETPEQSAEDLRVMQRAAVETYLRRLPGAEGEFDFFPMSDQWIEENLVTRSYEGQVTQEDLTFYENACEMQIDSETLAAMKIALTNDARGERMAALSVMVLTGLAGLIGCSAVTGMLSRRTYRRDLAKASVAAGATT